MRQALGRIYEAYMGEMRDYFIGHYNSVQFIQSSSYFHLALSFIYLQIVFTTYIL
jgi:hypothetical protein